MNYCPHEYAELFPLMSGEEFVALKNDIREHGLLEPIWIYDGKILDGRNRFRACQEIGANMILRDYEGSDPLGFVVSLNLKRRHLNESQRAMVAAKLAMMTKLDTLIPGNKSGSGSRNSVNQKISTTQAGGMLNVSADSVIKAKKIESQCEPELIDKVKSGEVSVNAAYQAASFDAETQKEIVDEINNGEKPAAVIKKHVHVSKNSGENEWYTPPKFIEAARAVMGSIDLDPASSEIANQTVKAGQFFTKEVDGLTQVWYGNIWMNPPYAQPLMNQFAEKLVSSRPDFKQAIVLVNNATETQWFQSVAAVSSVICFPSARIKFLDPSGKKEGAPLQGQAILYIGDNAELFIAEFSVFGFTALIK